MEDWNTLKRCIFQIPVHLKKKNYYQANIATASCLLKLCGNEKLADKFFDNPLIQKSLIGSIIDDGWDMHFMRQDRVLIALILLWRGDKRRTNDSTTNILYIDYVTQTLVTYLLIDNILPYRDGFPGRYALWRAQQYDNQFEKYVDTFTTPFEKWLNLDNTEKYISCILISSEQRYYWCSIFYRLLSTLSHDEKNSKSFKNRWIEPFQNAAKPRDDDELQLTLLITEKLKYDQKQPPNITQNKIIELSQGDKEQCSVYFQNETDSAKFENWLTSELDKYESLSHPSWYQIHLYYLKMNKNVLKGISRHQYYETSGLKLFSDCIDADFDIIGSLKLIGDISKPYSETIMWAITMVMIPILNKLNEMINLTEQGIVWPLQNDHLIILTDVLRIVDEITPFIKVPNSKYSSQLLKLLSKLRFFHGPFNDEYGNPQDGGSDDGGSDDETPAVDWIPSSLSVETMSRYYDIKLMQKISLAPYLFANTNNLLEPVPLTKVRRMRLKDSIEVPQEVLAMQKYQYVSITHVDTKMGYQLNESSKLLYQDRLAFLSMINRWIWTHLNRLSSHYPYKKTNCEVERVLNSLRIQFDSLSYVINQNDWWTVMGNNKDSLSLSCATSLDKNDKGSNTDDAIEAGCLLIIFYKWSTNGTSKAIDRYLDDLRKIISEKRSDCRCIYRYIAEYDLICKDISEVNKLNGLLDCCWSKLLCIIIYESNFSVQHEAILRLFTEMQGLTIKLTDTVNKDEKIIVQERTMDRMKIICKFLRGLIVLMDYFVQHRK